MCEMAAEVYDGLELHRERIRPEQQAWENLAGGLDPALSPPSLLHLQSLDRFGDLGQDCDVIQISEPPAGHLSTVTEIQILRERVGTPATGVLEALATPQAGGTVEVEEAAGGITPALLVEKVPVEQK